jgi:hypothetical protein
LTFRPSVFSSLARISVAARVESPVSTMIQPPGASIAKLLAMPQPRSAYTPSVTRSTCFWSPMPHFSSASSAVLVVTAPFGPMAVSLCRDGLLQDAAGCAARCSAAVSAAWAIENAPSASAAMTTTTFRSLTCMIWFLRRLRRLQGDAHMTANYCVNGSPFRISLPETDLRAPGSPFADSILHRGLPSIHYEIDGPA